MELPGSCLCGSKLPVLEEDGSHAIIPAGAPDGDPGLRAIAHFFVADRAPWFEVSDSVAQYPGFPPESFWSGWDGALQFRRRRSSTGARRVSGAIS
jgi:hypothetical protein